MSEKIPRILCPTATLTYNNVKRSYVNTSYSTAIEYVNGILIPISTRKSWFWDNLLDTADGLLLQGGCDIHPSMYGEKSSSFTTGCDRERDAVEKFVLEKAIERKIPTLAICRGMQMLNIVCGGTLYLDLPAEHQFEHNNSNNPDRSLLFHQVKIGLGNSLHRITGSTLIEVNSLHHQGIKKLGVGLNVLGVSPSGLVEAIEVQNHPYCIGVQWHPEEILTEARQEQLLGSFIEAAQK